MKATGIFIEEHNVILKVLDCLKNIVDEMDKNNSLNAEAANKAIDFIKNFADHTHHAKEEDRLFIAMEEHGFSRDGGPTGVMLHEHETGREFVGGMARVVEKAAAGDKEAMQLFAENARNFIELLTNHITKENNILFPMADQTLGEDAMDKMLLEFKQIEAEAGGERHEKYFEVARQLCEQYGVPIVENAQIQTITTELIAN